MLDIKQAEKRMDELEKKLEASDKRLANAVETLKGLERIKSEYNILRQTLVWAAECSLATVEYQKGLKNPVKHELSRHETIAKRLLMVLKMFNISPEMGGVPGERVGPCGRVKERLEALENDAG